MPIPTQVPTGVAAPDSVASPDSAVVPITPLTAAADAPMVAPHLSTLELTLSSHLLIFALLIVAIEAIVIRLAHIDSEGAIRLITVTLILISILYLTTAGYGSQQITAATGLLGTIAGYLLGRNSGRNIPPTPPPAPNSTQSA